MATRQTRFDKATTRSFGRGEGGGVIVIFALALVPLIMMAGMVIDYAVNSNARQQAQTAVDSAALALAMLPAGTTDADLTARAQSTVRAALANAHVDGLSVSMDHAGDIITVTAKGTTATSLTRIARFQSMPLNVSGTANRSMTNLEIALVLDNTGSMAGAKLTNLKSAASDLVTKLFKQADPSKANALRIGVVPFSMTVNTGPGSAGSPWLDLYAESSVHKQTFATTTSAANRFSLFAAMKKPWAGCVEARPAPYDVQDTTPNRNVPDTLYVPYFAPDESDNDYNAVNDYMSDLTLADGFGWGMSDRTRQGQINKYSKNAFKVSATARQAGTGYLYGPNSGCEIQPLTRLSTSQSTLTSAINAMTVVGDTNIPLGLVWGWNLLSPNGPYRDGVPYADASTKKFVVLMTDGQNQSAYSNSSNQSYYSGIGFIWQNRVGTTSSDGFARTSAIDGRLSQLCSNMKSAGVQIFTVRVEVTDGTSDVLRNCASSATMFFDVKDSSGLSSVFQAIADQISELRISK